jgi:hypothetical protein
MWEGLWTGMVIGIQTTCSFTGKYKKILYKAMSALSLKGLIIKEPWIDFILAGKKMWEIRGSNTKIRGTIALIKSGSGTVVGLCELKDSIGPLSINKLSRARAFHGIPSHQIKRRLPYPKTYAWVICNAVRLPKPVFYSHPRGAVIWVNLSNSVVKQICYQMNFELKREENRI